MHVHSLTVRLNLTQLAAKKDVYSVDYAAEKAHLSMKY